MTGSDSRLLEANKPDLISIDLLRLNLGTFFRGIGVLKRGTRAHLASLVVPPPKVFLPWQW